MYCDTYHSRQQFLPSVASFYVLKTSPNWLDGRGCKSTRCHILGVSQSENVINRSRDRQRKETLRVCYVPAMIIKESIINMKCHIVVHFCRPEESVCSYSSWRSLYQLFSSLSFDN